jgi:hypothetical protein
MVGGDWARVPRERGLCRAGCAINLPTYRIDNDYQDSVASTRATWDGEAAVCKVTIAAVIDEGEAKRNVR